MANVADFKTKVQAWGKEREAFRVRYDFAKDGGAAGTFNLFSVEGRHIVESAKAVVKTAVTSGSDPTLEVGKAGGDLDALIAQTQKAAMGANAIVLGVAQDATKHSLADGDVIALTIASGDLTDGVIDYLFELQKA